jgi:4-amino-4-deoxy-L-arabinose transferase-like glycosyltransferase
LIALLAVFTRAIAFRGFAASDDADYAQVAWELSQGQFSLTDPSVPPQYPGRLGVVMPVGALFRLFGPHEWTLLIFPVAASAATLALAYALGRTFFSHQAGLIAMAIYAVVPIDCRFATWLLSDVPGSAWAGAGVLALVLGARARANSRLVPGAGRVKALAGLIAAGCFGMSWLTRTQVAQLAPFVAAALILWSWRDRRNLWLAGCAAAGVLVIYLAEGLCYLRATGDFFYPFHAAERVFAMHSQWYYFKEGGAYGWAPGHYAFGLVRRLLWKGPSGLFLNANLALVPLVALLAAGHTLIWRRREFLFPAAWFLWAAFIFNFGSASLRHYEPLPWVDSYMVPVLLPACVLVGGWLRWAFASPDENRRLRTERRYWAALAGLAIALAAAFGLYQHARQGIGCPGTRQAAPYLWSDSNAPLYSDAMTLRGLKFFWAYRAPRPVRDFGRLSAGEIPAGAQVFVNPSEIQRMRDQVGYEPPAWVASPPPRWTLEKRWGDALLYTARR